MKTTSYKLVQDEISVEINNHLKQHLFLNMIEYKIHIVPGREEGMLLFLKKPGATALRCRKSEDDILQAS